MNKILLPSLVVSVAIIGILVFFIQNPKEEKGKVTAIQINENCKPTFRDGGGPYYVLNSPFREKIVPEENSGDKLTVRGRILQNDCKTPVANAVLDVWQANESGNYEDDWYRGQIRTNNGEYKFETVIPKGYGEGSGFRPPHIHFKVWQDNKELVTSQMFFPESKGKEGFEDEYIMDVKTLPDGSYEGIHDIIVP